MRRSSRRLRPKLRFCRGSLPALATRHLPGGGVEAVEEVGGGDHEDQSRGPLLVAWSRANITFEASGRISVGLLIRACIIVLL